MTQMSDLPTELIEEILSKVPMTSLKDIRSTCKKWNALSKNMILSKVEKQFLSFMMMDSNKLCSIQLNLHYNDEEVNPLIKQVVLFDKIEISRVFHCDGLLLCVIKDNKRLLVWNPYLCETKWILPREKFYESDMFALGYDQNRNHKILRLFSSGYEIYDLLYDSWSIYHLSPDWDWDMLSHQDGVSLKGNIYFNAQKTIRLQQIVTGIQEFLIYFDFTSERFGQPLPMPFNSYTYGNVDTLSSSLSCVGEDKLAVLHWYVDELDDDDDPKLDIWVTNKVDDDPKDTTTTWRKFINTLSFCMVGCNGDCFFIDEEKEVAGIFDIERCLGIDALLWQHTAHIIGKDGFYEYVNIGDAQAKYCLPNVCSSYAPSLVHLQNTKTRKRKQRH